MKSSFRTTDSLLKLPIPPVSQVKQMNALAWQIWRLKLIWDASLWSNLKSCCHSQNTLPFTDCSELSETDSSVQDFWKDFSSFVVRRPFKDDLILFVFRAFYNFTSYARLVNQARTNSPSRSWPGCLFRVDNSGCLQGQPSGKQDQGPSKTSSAVAWVWGTWFGCATCHSLATRLFAQSKCFECLISATRKEHLSLKGMMIFLCHLLSWVEKSLRKYCDHFAPRMCFSSSWVTCHGLCCHPETTEHLWGPSLGQVWVLHTWFGHFAFWVGTWVGTRFCAQPPSALLQWDRRNKSLEWTWTWMRMKYHEPLVFVKVPSLQQIHEIFSRSWFGLPKHHP